MELNHCCHEHPLILYEEQKSDGDEDLLCTACLHPIIQGPVYGCTKCSLFLHKICAELPREIKHDMHPHRLSLVADCLEAKDRDPHYYCDACNELSFGFYYTCTCSSCKFEMDIVCASLPKRIENPCHEHPLTLLRQQAIFKCEACGEKPPFKLNRRFSAESYSYSYSYLCTTCQFWVHPKCALLQSTVKFSCHDHPLVLTKSLQPLVLTKSLQLDDDDEEEEEDNDNDKDNDDEEEDEDNDKDNENDDDDEEEEDEDNDDDDDEDEYEYEDEDDDKDDDNHWSVCVLCGGKVMHTAYWFYFCADCSFAVHTGCLTRERKSSFRIKKTRVKSEELLDKVVDRITDDVEEEGLRKGLVAMTGKFNHFSHVHGLTLCNEIKNNDEKCDGCVKSISNTLFYHCLECHYFLHKTCAELPSYIRHPLHEMHLLTLRARSTSTPDNAIFRCNACDNYCNGFVYTCDMCQFSGLNYDVQCSLIPKTLKHEAHDHDLVLRFTYKQFCNACGNVRDGPRLECADCNFSLDTNCATTLPLTGKHKCHRHVLSLTYSTNKDDSEEYYCDACETLRNPEHWTYRCAEPGCDISAHLKCLQSQYPRIKFGGSYKLDSHPHNVSLVEREHESSPCKRCGFPRMIPVFECAICNLIVDDVYEIRYNPAYGCECWKLNR